VPISRSILRALAWAKKERAVLRSNARTVYDVPDVVRPPSSTRLSCVKRFSCREQERVVACQCVPPSIRRETCPRYQLRGVGSHDPCDTSARFLRPIVRTESAPQEPRADDGNCSSPPGRPPDSSRQRCGRTNISRDARGKHGGRFSSELSMRPDVVVMLTPTLDA